MDTHRGRAIAFYTQSPAYLLAVSRERTPLTHLHRICVARRHPPRDNRFATCRKLVHFGYRHQSHSMKDLRHVAGALDSNVGVMRNDLPGLQFDRGTLRRQFNDVGREDAISIPGLEFQQDNRARRHSIGTVDPCSDCRLAG